MPNWLRRGGQVIGDTLAVIGAASLPDDLANWVGILEAIRLDSELGRWLVVVAGLLLTLGLQLVSPTSKPKNDPPPAVHGVPELDTTPDGTFTPKDLHAVAQANSERVFLTNVQHVIDELAEARRVMFTGIDEGWWWDQSLDWHVWENVRESFRGQRGFTTAYNAARKAYDALIEVETMRLNFDRASRMDPMLGRYGRAMQNAVQKIDDADAALLLFLTQTDAPMPAQFDPPKAVADRLADLLRGAYSARDHVRHTSDRSVMAEATQEFTASALLAENLLRVEAPEYVADFQNAAQAPWALQGKAEVLRLMDDRLRVHSDIVKKLRERGI